jgi:DNA-binding SARP family transcriptional activator
MIHVSALGHPEITVDGKEAPKELRWRKNLGLLVYVARAPRGRRSRDLLTNVFWGDKPETTARHSLNEALRVIRKLLPDGALTADGDQITLTPGTVTFDLDEFLAHAGAGELDEARALIRGAFMEGFTIPDSNEFEDWLSGERRIWRQHCTEVLEQVAVAHLEAGDLSAARVVAHDAETLDPVADTAVRVLMQCDALRGDPSAALATYQGFVERLQRDLGLEPPESVSNLADRIRAQRAVADEAIRSEDAGLSRRLPLTGRGHELRDGVDAVRACARDFSPALVVITGSLGTGKTRLAEEIILRAELDGFHAARVRCDEADRTTRHGALCALVADTELFGESARFEDPEQFGEALSEAAKRRPVLIWVDSAEHLDPESYLALAPLMGRLADLRVTIMLSANDAPSIPELDALTGRLGRDFSGKLIELESIDLPHLAKLARRSLPDWSDDEIDRLARRLNEDTGGLPLLVVDMLHALRLGLEIEDEAPRAWPEPARTMDQTFPGEIPAPLGAAVRVGFRRLTLEAQEILKICSLVEGRVTVDLLDAAMDLDRPAIHDALDELEWRRWLTAEPRGYGFVARLHRDVIEQDMMTKGQRRRLAENLPPR